MSFEPFSISTYQEGYQQESLPLSETTHPVDLSHLASKQNGQFTMDEQEWLRVARLDGDNLLEITDVYTDDTKTDYGELIGHNGDNYKLLLCQVSRSDEERLRGGFQKTQWEMSLDEVKALYPDHKFKKQGTNLEFTGGMRRVSHKIERFYIERDFMGRKARYIFEFNKTGKNFLYEGLVNVRVMLRRTSDRAVAEMAALLSEKYGQETKIYRPGSSHTTISGNNNGLVTVNTTEGSDFTSYSWGKEGVQISCWETFRGNLCWVDYFIPSSEEVDPSEF